MPSGRGHGGHQKGWDYIYKDANKEFGSGTLGWGPLVTQGEFDLTYNLFMIDRPAQGYAENQFEVVYHDKNRTRIRLVPERDDRMVLLQGGPLEFGASFACAGTTIRCGALYEIRKNGWYKNGRLVRAFKEN